MAVPKTTKALVLRRAPTDAKPLYHDAVIEDVPIGPLRQGQILVKLGAVAFNHRDLWIRKGMYPGIKFGAVLGGDGAVIAVGPGEDGRLPLLHQRVMLVPMRGWESHPDAPEGDMKILGGGATAPSGTFSECVVVESDQVIPTPEHLDDVQASTWGIGGVTAWRAVVVNARVKKGDNVLITGIGGGVALVALQLCIARGARVFVTSGNEQKIQKAIALGAVGGVNYKHDSWPDVLGELLQSSAKSDGGKPLLDAVIDSAGGPIMQKIGRRLKQGGRVVCYGMTAIPQITLTMREVMSNQQLIGSTMGSKADLLDCIQFVAEKRITPVVSHTLNGLQEAEQGFELLKRGEQFGKIVIDLRVTGSGGQRDTAKNGAKL
ncbi:NAD(P)-binding protein [Punctularia strigosozonata HHB-11173 SS5]|uniref:NAD(P)-binding protein n=1 Tax=Punctularia strigosozonata (strain HHB-11173) TaxID=741275 RepID=UPI0004417C5E|nr:NAD(P)-binding protein [Punctularia strigosozonata HHB-11173 SS5]EIN07030.1 NAD(P)-binding protein [Punctularia strigosozonata HHB-11173 SS5]